MGLVSLHACGCGKRGGLGGGVTGVLWSRVHPSLSVPLPCPFHSLSTVSSLPWFVVDTDDSELTAVDAAEVSS